MLFRSQHNTPYTVVAPPGNFRERAGFSPEIRRREGRIGQFIGGGQRGREAYGPNHQQTERQQERHDQQEVHPAEDLRASEKHRRRDDQPGDHSNHQILRICNHSDMDIYFSQGNCEGGIFDNYDISATPQMFKIYN